MTDRCTAEQCGQPERPWGGRRGTGEPVLLGLNSGDRKETTQHGAGKVTAAAEDILQATVLSLGHLQGRLQPGAHQGSVGPQGRDARNLQLWAPGPAQTPRRQAGCGGPAPRVRRGRYLGSRGLSQQGPDSSSEPSRAGDSKPFSGTCGVGHPSQRYQVLLLIVDRHDDMDTRGGALPREREGPQEAGAPSYLQSAT